MSVKMLRLAPCALLLSSALTSIAAARSLSEVASGLDIDAQKISVSGISSGAYMAQQFHVIHSEHVMGVGVVAGGPYRCADGDYFSAWFDWTGLYVATSICSNTNPYWFFVGPPDLEYSVAETRTQAAAGAVDATDHMRSDRVWLFAGEQDEEIPPAVMDVLEDYYMTFVDGDNIDYQKHPRANHAMITDDFGSACDALTSPYINDCDYDAARLMLEHIYGELGAKTPEAQLGPVIAFDQDEFFDTTDGSVSMNTVGHVYVPASCVQGARCALHVAFHGCQQTEQQIGDAFYTGAGYNEWAESNGIVVLYPQTVAWSTGGFFNYHQNPKACWDWWGYSGDNYYRKDGKQIVAVARMINTLIGQPLLGLGVAPD